MFAVTFAARVASADQIAEISVEENKKTTADTVELIAKRSEERRVGKECA